MTLHDACGVVQARGPACFDEQYYLQQNPDLK